MKREDVDVFEKLSGQLISIYDEMTLLSKKNPNDGVNKFKLELLNVLLSKSNQFLEKEYIPFDDFSLFDVDSLPQNSDVVFILSQYIQCFEKKRSDNVVYKTGSWSWCIDAEEDEKSDEKGKIYIRTVKPKKLRD